MADSIFLDANIPMYAAGRVHPLKQPCIDVLSLAAHHPARVITDAEVFQEILHRYRAIGRWHDGEQLFRKFIELMRNKSPMCWLRTLPNGAAASNVRVRS